VRSGTFTVKADGTCSTKTRFVPPSGSEIAREVSATYTKEGSKLTLQWKGAGTTTGTVEDSTFTMDNEGMLFVYRNEWSLEISISMSNSISPALCRILALTLACAVSTGIAAEESTDGLTAQQILEKMALRDLQIVLQLRCRHERFWPSHSRGAFPATRGRETVPHGLREAGSVPALAGKGDVSHPAYLRGHRSDQAHNPIQAASGHRDCGQNWSSTPLRHGKITRSERWVGRRTPFLCSVGMRRQFGRSHQSLPQREITAETGRGLSEIQPEVNRKAVAVCSGTDDVQDWVVASKKNGLAALLDSQI
jgi:hypothetical protein